MKGIVQRMDDDKSSSDEGAITSYLTVIGRIWNFSAIISLPL